MILVLAGTKDGRELIERLKPLGEELIATVVTDYGFELLALLGIEVLKGALDEEGLKRLVKDKGVKTILDATHPFAVEISQLAISIGRELNLDYLRFERKEIDLDYGEEVIRARGYREGAEIAASFNKVLLTVGSKSLNYFVEGIEGWEEKLVARVLPNWIFIKKAQELGFTPKNLIGIQGPFSKELNKRLLIDYGIDLLVTKASGEVGGLDTKIEAALELGVKVLVIDRPEIDYPKLVNTYEEVVDYIRGG